MTASRTAHVRLALLGLLLVAAVVLVLTAGAQAGRRGTQASPAGVLRLPVWSPDGRHVAWVATEDANPEKSTLWVSNFLGRRARPLHSFPSSQIQAAWVTPTSLLAETGGHLYRLGLTGRVRLLTQIHGGWLALDPSRRFVAASGEEPLSGTGSIEILNLRTGKVRRVGSPADVNADLALSPGAHRVLYERYTCDTSGDCSHYRGIWVARVDGRGKPHRVLRSDYYCPVWSPDGRLIAYTRPAGYPNGNYRPGSIGILRVGGRGRLIASPGNCLGLSRPAFSPDSRFIAFEANTVRQTPGSRLAVIDLSTRRVVLRSARRLGQVDGQAWSPDGSKILLVARYHEQEGLGCLYVGNVATRRWRLFRPCENEF
jgi:Tol biopolymer transport system component